MDVSARKPAEAGDTFRHYTGLQYTVIAIARDADEPQDLVIHRGLLDGLIWSTPMKRFMGCLAEGQPRFEYTGGLTTPAEASPAEAMPELSREDYDDIEGYAVAAMIGALSTGFGTRDDLVAQKAFDVAQAMLAEKKNRLGEKPDHHF